VARATGAEGPMQFEPVTLASGTPGALIHAMP